MKLEAENRMLREFFDASEEANARPVRCDPDCMVHRQQYDRWEAARAAVLAAEERAQR